MDTSPPKKKAKLEDDSVTTGLDVKNNPIHIDPNGNLKLIVGPAAVQMHVDANALRRSSKVFDRMLFGGLREAHQTDEWTVELPEDDPEALRVIFHAAHANFRDLPPTLSLSQLYYITVMADKYGMIGTLQPWMANWTSAETHPELWTSEDENETSREDLQRLCVLYYQGLPQQFYEILLRVLIKTKSNSSCKLLYSTGFAGDGKGSSSDSHEWAEFTLLPFGLLSKPSITSVRSFVCLLKNPSQEMWNTSDANQFSTYSMAWILCSSRAQRRTAVLVSIAAAVRQRWDL
ncbi:hypothetical protein N8I77_011807 [Diaporthe amygdali]|uniref:BTB domain-containing protein n=1 Tax=Phomopsis amygdali TaxID=1214568 RepID=A0AAD9S3G5_PHOAM|nr:hypothetical protein N8I77_011807 [Diaporthe amygdali]